MSSTTPAAHEPPRPAAEAKPATITRLGNRRGARRAFGILGGIVLAVLFLVAGYLIYSHGKESTDDARVEADVVALTPQVGGRIAEVLVADDTRVHKGQPVFRIDDADLSAQVRKAEGELATARARADAAEAQVHIAGASARGGLTSAQAALAGSSAQVTSAQASVESAQSELDKARSDLDRSRELRAAGAISQQALDVSQVTFDAARARLTAAQETLRAAESRVTEARGHLAQSEPVDARLAEAAAQAELARAGVTSAEASLQLARNDLAYATVGAPEDGVVSQLTARAGQLVLPGQPVGELVPLHRYVVANFKETQLGGIHPGDRAVVDVDAVDGHLEGKVASISGGTGARFSLLPADDATGNFVKVVQRVPVRIELTEPSRDVPLQAGLSAEVTVYSGK